jgi:hypothetical protein
MAGVTAQGATFTYNSFSGKISGISVEMPTAEVTDMTAVQDGVGYSMMVPTGEWSGGTITVDFITSNQDPQAFVKTTGQLVFSSVGYSISRRVVCQSASVAAQTGEIVRGSLKFLMTDYPGK